MNLADATTPAAAFVAGLATGLHCAGMCGPLACALRVKPAGYHASRVVSYAAAGALAALLGRSVLRFFTSEMHCLLPWFMAAVLLLIGFGLEKKIPSPRFMSALLLRVRLSPVLGFLTPLLPCGPLYLMLGVAIVAGTPLAGATLLAAFAAGTIPVYALLQISATRMQGRFSPRAMTFTQRGLALTSAGVLIWRAAVPLCCHG
jgi:uncharacterized protein